MGDHYEKEIIDELELQGVQGYVDEYLKAQGHHSRGGPPNMRGVENQVKIQSKWYKARERLQAKLALKAVTLPTKKMR